MYLPTPGPPLLIFSLLAASSALAQHEAHVLPKTQLVKSRQSIIDNWIIGQPVGTTSGLVDGHPAPNATLVSEYLGIPYAEPPVGNLRFQPPVKYNGTSVVDATDFGNSCINTIPPKEANQTYLQEISATPFGLSLANGSLFTPQTQNQSEDCLTLNIWTKPQTGQPNKAVLIYIHSSSASSYSNSSSSPFNNPQWLVNDQDVIVVTFNYRVGIFGYPGNPVSSPNLGLLDVRLAIEWVRDNIAEFGGDPSRITLFGHGTGASIADSYSFALPWVDDPIVQAFILMSGTAVAYEPLDNRTAWENWFNTTEKLGCGGARDNRTEVWQCMLGLDAKDIADAAASLSVAGDLGEVASFRPTVDDTLIFGNYTDRKPIPAPVLVGNTDDEAGIYKLTSPGRTNESWEQVNRLQFGCPAAWRAGVNARNGNPTWRYRYFASFPNLRLFESSGGNGPWHGSDILLLFNHTPVNWLPNTAQEIAFGKYFRGAWAAFAHDPFTGLSGYTAPNINTQPWPQYNLTDRLSTIIRLGWHNQLGPNLLPSLSGTSNSPIGTSGNSTREGPGGAGGEDWDVECPTSWPVPRTDGNDTTGTGANPSATATATGTSVVPTGTSTSTSTSAPTGGASSGGSSSSGSPLFGLSSSGAMERTLWVGLFVSCFAFFASQ